MNLSWWWPWTGLQNVCHRPQVISAVRRNYFISVFKWTSRTAVACQAECPNVLFAWLTMILPTILKSYTSFFFFFSYRINAVENLYVASRLSVSLETILSLVNYRNNNFIKYMPHLSLNNLLIFLSKHAREYRYSTFLNLRIYRSLGIKKYFGNKVFYFYQRYR